MIFADDISSDDKRQEIIQNRLQGPIEHSKRELFDNFKSSVANFFKR